MASKIIYLLKILLFLLIMILFTMFMSNNLDFVKVNLAPFDYILEISLFFLITISFVFGVFFTVLSSCISSFFGLKDLYQYIKNKKMEREITKLKNKFNKKEFEDE